MGKFLESPIAIDRTKLVRAATATSPAPPPPMTITVDLTTATYLYCIPSIVPPVMLLLDYQNALIQSLLTERFSGYVLFLPLGNAILRIVYT